MNKFTEFTMLKHVRETLVNSTAVVAPLAIGDPPSLLNTKCANWTDVVVVGGKAYDKDAVAKLLAERNALATEVDEANERVAEVAAERDALAAHNQALVSVLGRMVARFEMHHASSELIKRAIHVIDATPQQCLAEIRAEAARAGFIAGADAIETIQMLGSSESITDLADEYAAKVRQGGAE